MYISHIHIYAYYGYVTLQQVSEKKNCEFAPVKLYLKLTLCRILLDWRAWVHIYIYMHVIDAIDDKI